MTSGTESSQIIVRVDSLDIKGVVQAGLVEIFLKKGGTVVCQRPYQIGREYDTPNLERKKCREWNISIAETLSYWRRGERYTQNPYFIVGMWGSAAGSTKGVIAKIPFAEVRAFESIPAPPCLPGCAYGPGHVGACRISPVKYAVDMKLTSDQILDAIDEFITTRTSEDLVGYLVRDYGETVAMEILRLAAEQQTD